MRYLMPYGLRALHLDVFEQPQNMKQHLKLKNRRKGGFLIVSYV
jgi:hypothetical protein